MKKSEKLKLVFEFLSDYLSEDVEDSCNGGDFGEYLKNGINTKTTEYVEDKDLAKLLQGKVGVTIDNDGRLVEVKSGDVNKSSNTDDTIEETIKKIQNKIK